MAETGNGDLNVELGVTLGKLNRGLAQAEARFNAATRKMERDANTGSQRGADAMARNYSRAVDRATAQTQRMNTAVRQMNSEFGRAGGGIQNAAFQIGDFATQVGAGGRASTALAQQLPQLLGGFGALGAVMGAAVAIGIPAYFALTRDSAMSLEDQIDDLTQSVRAYRDAVEAAQQSPLELGRTFGGQTEEAREFLRIQQEIARIRAAESLSTAQGGVIEGIYDISNLNTGAFRETIAMIEDYSTRIAELQTRIVALQQAGAGSDQTGPLFAQIEEYRTFLTTMGETEVMLTRIGEQFNASRAEAIAMVDAMLRMQDAPGPREAAEAAEDLARIMSQVTDKFRGASSEIRSLGEGLLDVVLKGLEFQALDLSSPPEMAAQAIMNMLSALEDAVGAGSALASALGGANGVAASLASSMWTVAQNAWAAATAMAAAESTRAEARSVQGYMLYQRTRELEVNPPTMPAQYNRAPARGGGGGSPSGGGGASGPDLLEEFQQLMRALDPLVRAEHDLAEAQETVNAALAAGKVGAEEAARAMGLARERYDEAAAAVRENAEAWADFGDAAASEIDRLIDGTASLEEALISLLAQWAKLEIQKGLLGLVSGGSSGDSIGQLIVKGIMGGFGGSATTSPSFDGGGYTGSGARTGGIDGKGGFPAIVHPNETIIDHTKGGAAPGGTVTIIIQEAPGFASKVSSMAQEVAVKTVAAYDTTLPGRVASISRDPRAR